TGHYGIRNTTTLNGNIFENSQPPPDENRGGTFRSVSEVDGKAHAIGLRGLAHRLDGLTIWTRIDDGLSPKFNGQALHGVGAMELYAVGNRGQLWQFNGRTWTNRDLPTNVNLTSVKC